MDQISPPMRIVLAVAVVFLAAYMLVLKPKDEEVAPAPTPATAPAVEAGGPEAGTALGTAVEQANEAANASEAASQAASGETVTNAPSTTNSESATKPAGEAQAAKPAAKPAEPVDEALADLPKWLQTSIDKQVVAVLFTNGESADDKRTSKALQRAYDYDGDVVTRVVNVKKISDYQAIADGVDVSQSPTLMVIARDRSATAFAGYSSLNTINQAIIDATLATDNPVKDVPFLQTVQGECRALVNADVIGVTDGSTPAGARKNVRNLLITLNGSLAAINKTKVPPAYRPLAALTRNWLVSEKSVATQLLPVLSGKSVNTIKVVRIVNANDNLTARARVELNAVGVSTCN